MAEAALANPKTNEASRCDLLRWQAEALRQLGRTKEAEASAGAALALAEKFGAANPGSPTPQLIMALSVAGRADQAIEAARRYAQDGNPNIYPTRRWLREQTLACVLARAGRIRESVAIIRQQLAVPSFFTVPMLRAEFDWDNLRDDPEFKALLADPKNSAPL